MLSVMAEVCPGMGPIFFWDFGAMGGVALFGLDPGFLMFYGALLVVCTFGRFGLGASGLILPSI